MSGANRTHFDRAIASGFFPFFVIKVKINLTKVNPCPSDLIYYDLPAFGIFVCFRSFEESMGMSTQYQINVRSGSSKDLIRYLIVIVFIPQV